MSENLNVSVLGPFVNDSGELPFDTNTGTGKKVSVRLNENKQVSILVGDTSREFDPSLNDGVGVDGMYVIVNR